MDLQSIITGVIVGAVVAIVTFRLSSSLERERWRREDRIRREDLDRQAAERWANERRELYGRLLRSVEDLRSSARRRYVGNPALKNWNQAWNDSYDLAVQIALITPELEDFADSVHREACDLLTAAKDFGEEHDDDQVEPPPMEEREQALNDAYEAFVKAAQANLRPTRLVAPPSG